MDDIGKICQETQNIDVLVWSPNHSLSDAELDEFLSIAKEKHGYNMEQALGMLFWHNHDIKKALEDLNNFTPVSEEWTLAEKALFEQGFSIHGKLFHKIQQMLPGKSIQSIVKYYYSWKKTSVMGQNAHKQKRKRKGRGKKIGNEDQEKDSKKLKKSRK